MDRTGSWRANLPRKSNNPGSSQCVSGSYSSGFWRPVSSALRDVAAPVVVVVVVVVEMLTTLS